MGGIMGMDQYLRAKASNGQVTQLAKWRKHYDLNSWFQLVALERGEGYDAHDYLLWIEVRASELEAMKLGGYRLAVALDIEPDIVDRALDALKAGCIIEYQST